MVATAPLDRTRPFGPNDGERPLSTGASVGRRPAPRSGPLWAAGASALLSGLYWAVYLRHYRPISDAMHYDGIARNVARGLGIAHEYPGVAVHPTAFRPPMWPALLGGAYRIAGAHLAVGQALNLVLGAVGAALVYLVAAELANPRAGLVAGLVFAAYPPLLANNVTTLSEPLGIVVLLCAVCALVRRRPLLAGVAAGLLALTWTSGQLFVVLVALCAWRLVGRRGAVAALVAGLCVVAPWSVRNEVRVGTPQLDTSNGYNLAAVYSPETQRVPHVYSTDPVTARAFDTPAWQAARADEATWDQLLRNRGITGIKDNPVRVLETVRHNVAAMFDVGSPDNRYADHLDGRSRTVRAIGSWCFPIVTALGLAGLALSMRSPGVGVVVAVTAYFGALTIPTVMAPRLRGPFDLACCLGCGLLVRWAIDRRATRKAGSAPVDLTLAEKENMTVAPAPSLPGRGVRAGRGRHRLVARRWGARVSAIR